MSGACGHLYARFHEHYGYLDCDLAEEEEVLLGEMLARDHDDDGFQLLMQHLQEPLESEIPDGFWQRSTDLIGHFQDRSRRAADDWARIDRFRELGFRFEVRDLPDAAMSMLSFVMEHDEGGNEGGHQDIDGDEEDEAAPELDREEEMAMELENEEEPRPRRWRKPQKPRRPYSITCALRKTNWFESSMEWENEHFRAVYRMSKDTFWGIVHILERNVIFQSQGRKKQRPVHYQLGVFLLRYGISGSHARHPKLLTSIGEGTVVLYCRRVIRAIREHGLEYVAWPTEERKIEIKKGFKKICGLDNIIGSMDGTLCGLETKPQVDGDSYISRKKTLSVNVQAVVDHEGLFIAFQSGWAGSRPDIAIWPNTWIFKEQDRLFANGEFLIADGGYTLSPLVLIPYKRNELKIDGRRRRNFNYKFSRARIVVEWTFGRLKARFPALRKLGAARDMNDIYRAIEAMMILHNICQLFGDALDGLRTQPDDDEDLADEDEEEDGEEGTDEYDIGLGNEGNADLLSLGRAFRERCVDFICPP